MLAQMAWGLRVRARNTLEVAGILALIACIAGVFAVVWLAGFMYMDFVFDYQLLYIGLWTLPWVIAAGIGLVGLPRWATAAELHFRRAVASHGYLLYCSDESMPESY